MAGVFAQENGRIGKKDFKAGDEIAKLPDGVTMQDFVTAATTGKLGDEKPKVEPAPPVSADKPADRPK